MVVRTTIQVDEELLARLQRFVSRRGLSRFINQAVAEKIDALERAAVEAEMREGYLATASDRADLNREWEVVDVESWPA